MSPKLEFIKPGLYTSLQDQGRITGRHWGLPQGGAMDLWSARRANLKLNNSPNLPVLEINFESTPPLSKTNTRLKKHLLFSDKPIQIMAGPEYDLLTKTQQTILTNTNFSIAPSASRMAYPLSPKITSLTHAISLITSPVVPGVVQLTPDGQLIVLMRDAQTTGGYPRVLVVSETEMNRLGQMRGGDDFSFGF